MTLSRICRCALTVSVAVFTACSSGGGGGAATAPQPPVPADPVPELVADLNLESGSEGSEPRGGVEFAGAVYLQMASPETGVELFRTDGTLAGTELVADISPGSTDSFPGRFHVVGSQLFFTASDEDGRELWVTDGTTAGTRQVRDLREGPRSTSFSFLGVLGNELFFGADDPARGVGSELYASDGQVIRLVADIEPGAGDSGPFGGASFDGRLFFRATTSGAGGELWSTDGTTAGTVLVADVNPGSPTSNPRQLTALGSHLFFVATQSGVGRELFRTDGTTSGTTLVIDMVPGSTSSNPVPLAEFAGDLLFVADSPDGRELHRTDGTAAGTELVLDINPGGADAFPTSSFQIVPGVELPAGILFFADDGVSGTEPWMTNGTAAGTFPLGDLEPGTESSEVREVRRTGNVALFLANTTAFGREPWITDGTVAGTALLVDIDPGIGFRGRAEDGAVSIAGSLGDDVLLQADNGESGRELWLANPVGVTLVDVLPPKTGDALPRSLTPAGDRLFFRARTPGTGNELCVSDGTAAGTQIIDIRPGPESSVPRNLTAFDGGVLFAADDGTTGSELFASDGTVAGTRLVRDMVPGSSPSGPTELTVLGDRVVFATFTSSESKLWVTDGTTAGTQELADLNLVQRLTAFDGRVFFEGADNAGTTGRELYVTDGTAAGTGLFFDAVPGPNSSSLRILGVANDRLVFSARDSNQESLLFATDGTVAGTEVLDPATLGGIDFAAPVLEALDFLLFEGRRNSIAELWRTDGTAAGTLLLAAIEPGGGGVRVGSFTWFAATEKTAGSDFELWRTDGTPEGTQLVRERPGALRVMPSAFVRVNDDLGFVQMADSEHGRELWEIRGDGSIALRHDILPGPADSLREFAADAVVLGDQLFLTADDGGSGLELFRLQLK